MFKFILASDSIISSHDGHHVLSIVKNTSIMYHVSEDPADNERVFSRVVQKTPTLEIESRSSGFSWF